MDTDFRNGRGEAGQTLILFTLLITAALGIVGLVTDVGLAFREKAHYQAAADAAVLASVQALSVADDEDEAIQEAIDYVLAHGIPEEAVEVNIPPTSGAAVGDDQCVEVTISYESPATFSKVLGFEIFEVNAWSIACLSSLEAFTGVMPWAVLESAINYDGSPTPIKYDSNNGSNGDFGALRLFGSGSQNYENNIKYGVQGSICAESQPACSTPWEETEPGNMTGGTRDGVNFRLDNSIDECDEFDEVFTPDGVGGYDIVDDCNTFDGVAGSTRILLVPVVDSFCNGQCTVTLKYFVLIFLNDLGGCQGNSCEVTGTFVERINDPDAELGFTPGESAAGPPRLVE